MGGDEFDASLDDPSNLVIGDFGRTGDPHLWQVFWVAETGEVRARRQQDMNETEGVERQLGCVPSIEYVYAIVQAIGRSRRNSSWRRSSGVDDIERWLGMLRAALDGESGDLAAGIIDGPDVYYIDFGHGRADIDGLKGVLAASELWEDLDEMATKAAELSAELVERLGGDGNLAQAAAASRELLEWVIGVHIALSNAYQIAHRHLPRVDPPVVRR